jgi:hypothetical protein
MILITSAAYVNSEFQIEFGRLPPAFLPVGNRRLFEHQIESLRSRFGPEEIYMSLPSSYHMAEKDQKYLMRHAVTVIRTDETLNLSTAVRVALGCLPQCDDVLRLLHGDTLVTQLPNSADLIGIVRTTDDYAWEVEQADRAAESIWCGYFCFSSSHVLAAALDAEPGSFTRAVRRYSEARTLERAEVTGWFDFGHVNTYFHSRAQLTTERAFNSLRIDDGCVRKTGVPLHKIRAEANWFSTLPTNLRVFVPQLIGQGGEGNDFSYTLEYLPFPPLNEVFVHGRNPTFYWDKVFGKCADFMQRCSQHQLDAQAHERAARDFNELASTKTWQRLQQFEGAARGFRVGANSRVNGGEVPPLKAIISDCLARLAKSVPMPGLMHGDLCLSNILFDSRSDRIKVIDPRGLDSTNEMTNSGDLRYDLAKLAHSVIGLYDHIIAGAFELSTDYSGPDNILTLDIHIDERILDIQKVFLDTVFVQDLSPRPIMPMVVLLFISMLPLHADRPERQAALLANALRLYSELDSLEPHT